MSTSWEPLPSTYRSKQEFLASLPPWRRLLQKLNWHPTIDVDVERYAIEQRLQRLEKEDERLAELNAKLSAILSSSVTSSSPPNAMPGESEM
jgi:fibronectin type 3 domain-containing protein